MSNIPVVFLPSILCDSALWQAQIQGFSGQITPYVADLTQRDTIPDMARDVLAKAPPRFALMGVSMGGYVAFEILRQAPERVQRLCLSGTSARPDTPEQRERRRLLLAMARTGHFRGVTPRLMPRIIHPGRLQDETLTGTIMAMAERIGREAFLRQQTAIMNRTDSRPGLCAIRCPSLVIGGRQDAITPPDITREIADGIPGADFTLIENCGHLAPLEHPETVNALMRRWLAIP